MGFGNEQKICEKYGIGLNYNSLEDLCEKHSIEFYKNESLSKYTTFEIGGKCDFLIKPHSIGTIRRVISFCRENNIKYHF